MLYHQLYVHDSRASLRAVFTLLKYTMPAPFLGLNWADRVVGGPGMVAAAFVEAGAALVVLGGALVAADGALVVGCNSSGTLDCKQVMHEREVSAAHTLPHQADTQQPCTGKQHGRVASLMGLITW